MKIFLLAILAIHAAADTKTSLVDHQDPYYFDSCLETSGELCEFCCLTDMAICSQDIQTCTPVLDRDLEQLWEAFYILGGIVFGFPLAVIIFRQFMIVRYLERCYPTTGGITIFDMMARCFYCFICCKNFAQNYQQVEAQTPATNQNQKKSKLFSCRKKPQD